MTSTWSTCRCRPRRTCSGARPRSPTANTCWWRSPSPAMRKTRRRWWPRRAPPDRHLIEGFHYRFHPLFQRALEALRGGAIGRIRHIEAMFNANLPDTPGELRYIEALGGGALMDLGCYCMHWIRTVAGDEPSVVSASARCGTPGVDIDDRSRARLHQRPDRDPEVFDAARGWRVVPPPARAGRQGTAGFRQPGLASFRRHAIRRVRPRPRHRRSSPAATPRFTTSCATCST